MYRLLIDNNLGIYKIQKRYFYFWWRFIKSLHSCCAGTVLRDVEFTTLSEAEAYIEDLINPKEIINNNYQVISYIPKHQDCGPTIL